MKEIDELFERNKEFSKPLYDDSCLSDIPSTILKLFGIKTKRPGLNRKLFQEIKSNYFEKVLLVLKDFSNNPPAFRQELN